MLSFRDGMQTLTDGIAAGIRRLSLATRATGIEPQAGRWSVSAEGPGGRAVYRAPVLVLAVPAEAAARLLRPLSGAAAAALEAIPYPPVAAVVSAYSRADIAHALDGFGFLVPEAERRGVLGTIFSSTLFENRAPEDTALLTSFVGGMRQPELAGQDEERIAAMVHEELAVLIGARARPRWTRVTRWARAIPQYTLGHGGRMAALEAVERELPGLHFCANFRGGISVADCIKSAYALAERITAAEVS